jgi:ArsR family transcriptional regulator, cadmium/lead-responsive transcriptional repressor
MRKPVFHTFLSDGGGANPHQYADALAVSRQSMSNHLTCLRGCGLVVAVPDGRRTRYELADVRLGHAIRDMLGVVLAVDPACCAPDGTCVA